MVMKARMWLGVDTGGTFTDFILFDGECLRVHKVLSTPAAPEQAILKGIYELGLSDPAAQAKLVVVHGSTVATNAALEGKGVRTAYITNYGLADVLSIGRQNRAELYNLQPQPSPPPVPRALCLETGGRIAADGREVEPLTELQLAALVEQIMMLKPESVAINLLFSFIDDRFEKAIEATLPEDVFVSRSSEVLPEYREYERGIATWLNAWVGPLMQRYLTRLKRGLGDASIAVMQSACGTIGIDQAGAHAVRLLLSGPAGGMAAAKFIGEQVGCAGLLTFDMGGTSTDVALIDGEIELTSEGRIGPYPVAVPMVDMHTIGAGGGSIAYVDEGGVLQVGPMSAGASPGPVCYGLGGEQVTVTDANLILNRLLPQAFLGGNMTLDVSSAEQAMDRLAQQLEVSRNEAAMGVIKVANEHMARALRVMSVQRGIDPRGLTLTSFGGAGGLHVCALAEGLGMARALVPIHAGVLSALGMLVAPRQRQLSRTLNQLLNRVARVEVEAIFSSLSKQGWDELLAEGAPAERLDISYSVDLRYHGQDFYLNVPWGSLSQMTRQFNQRHQQRLGHVLDFPIELVNVRVKVESAVDNPMLKRGVLPREEALAVDNDVVKTGKVKVLSRQQLVADEKVNGPALIVDSVSTTYLAPDWLCYKDVYGNLLLFREEV